MTISSFSNRAWNYAETDQHDTESFKVGSTYHHLISEGYHIWAHAWVLMLDFTQNTGPTTHTPLSFAQKTTREVDTILSMIEVSSMSYWWKTNLPTHPQIPTNPTPHFPARRLYLQPFHFPHLHRGIKFTNPSWYTCKSLNLLPYWDLCCRFFLYDDRKIDREYCIRLRRGYHDHKPSTTNPASNNGKPPASTELESKAGKQMVRFVPGAQYASIRTGFSVHPYPAVGRRSKQYIRRRPRRCSLIKEILHDYLNLCFSSQLPFCLGRTSITTFPTWLQIYLNWEKMAHRLLMTTAMATRSQISLSRR